MRVPIFLHLVAASAAFWGGGAHAAGHSSTPTSSAPTGPTVAPTCALSAVNGEWAFLITTSTTAAVGWLQFQNGVATGRVLGQGLDETVSGTITVVGVSCTSWALTSTATGTWWGVISNSPSNIKTLLGGSVSDPFAYATVQMTRVSTTTTAVSCTTSSLVGSYAFNNIAYPVQTKKKADRKGHGRADVFVQVGFNAFNGHGNVTTTFPGSNGEDAVVVLGQVTVNNDCTFALSAPSTNLNFVGVIIDDGYFYATTDPDYLQGGTAYEQ